MSVILLTNDITEYTHTIQLDVSIFNEELFGEWVEENLEENGVYEFDGMVDDGVYLIQIPDDSINWESNFNEVIRKITNELKKTYNN